MLEYDRIDISEVIDIKNKCIKRVIFVFVGTF